MNGQCGWIFDLAVLGKVDVSGMVLVSPEDPIISTVAAGRLRMDFRYFVGADYEKSGQNTLFLFCGAAVADAFSLAFVNPPQCPCPRQERRGGLPRTGDEVPLPHTDDACKHCRYTALPGSLLKVFFKIL